MTTPIERRQEQEAFRLIDMGAEYDRTNGSADIPHRHNYYTILTIADAKGYHMVDFHDYLLEGSQVHFIYPGQVHQLVCTERPKGWAMTFSSDFLMANNISESFITNINLFSAFGSFVPLSIQMNGYNRLAQVVQQMHSCHDMSTRWREQASGALLKLFLIQCSVLSQGSSSQFDESSSTICLVRDFRNMVDQKYHEWHKLSRYADELHITAKHLSQTVKSYTGRTGKDYIQDRILLEAKRLLFHTNLSIKEVAYQLGYQEPLHFSGFFKKQTGQSPTEFRSP